MRRPGAVPPADRIVRSRGALRERFKNRAEPRAGGRFLSPSAARGFHCTSRSSDCAAIAPPPVPTAFPSALPPIPAATPLHLLRFRLRRSCAAAVRPRCSVRGRSRGCVFRSRPCRSSCDRGRAAYRGGGKRRVPAVSREHRRDALRGLRAYFAKPWPMPMKSSALRAAPPISPPSTSSLAKSSAAFEGLHEPP